MLGASSGIGRATARRFADAGAAVVVAARSEPGLASLVGEIAEAGGRAVAQPADVTDYDQVAAVARRAVDEFGRLDTWAHVAGVTAYGRLEDLEPDEIRQVIEVDLVGAAFGARAAIPHLRTSGGGAIVLVSSVLGATPIPLQAPYVAAKHGVRGLADAIRIELAGGDAPITVTDVLPATIDTPLFDKARSRAGVVPTGPPPVYDPEVVAEAIVAAATSGRREVVVGGGGKLLTALARFAPGSTEAATAVIGEATTRTDEPLPGGFQPGNLFDPVPALDVVRGHFGATRRTSTWARLANRFPAPGRRVLDLAATAGRRLAKTARPGDRALR